MSDIEEVEWFAEDMSDGELQEEPDVEVVAPRILAGQEDKIHYQAETGYGMLSTTAEGAIGDKLRRVNMRTRTPEERFRDNLIRILAELSIPRDIGTRIMKLIPIIPDIKFKSAAGCLFGYMAVNLIGKELNAREQREFDNILKLVQQLKNKNQRISKLDIVRYARMFKRILRL